VVAPGYFVLGPLAGSTDYITKAGTSMATPVVAGLVALIFEVSPNLSIQDVKQVLTSQALSDGSTGSLPNNIYGYGKAFLGSVVGSGSAGGSAGGGGGGGGCNSASPDLYTALLALVLTAILRKRIRKVL